MPDFLGYDDDVTAFREQLAISSENLPNHSLGSISFDTFAKLFTDSYPKPSPACFVRKYED